MNQLQNTHFLKNYTVHAKEYTSTVHQEDHQIHKKLMTVHIRTQDNTSFNPNTESYPPKYYPLNSIHLKTHFAENVLLRQDLLDLCLFRLENGRQRQNTLQCNPEYKINSNALQNPKYAKHKIGSNTLKMIHRKDSSKSTSINKLKSKCFSLRSTQIQMHVELIWISENVHF